MLITDFGQEGEDVFRVERDSAVLMNNLYPPVSDGESWRKMSPQKADFKRMAFNRCIVGSGLADSKEQMRQDESPCQHFK